MEIDRIRQLLQPYLGGEELGEGSLQNISTYLDLLVKWNARMNLTAVRDPEQMVRRHLGESLFAARNLVPRHAMYRAIDVGSGAGFPGLPIAIFAPAMQVTLIESRGKKATFLKEVVRNCSLTNVNVKSVRAEAFAEQGELVTLRAVEKFEEIVPVAARLVSPGGRLAILIGAEQEQQARSLVLGEWQDVIPVPESASRVLAICQL